MHYVHQIRNYLAMIDFFLIILQAVLAIGGAALALVNSYIIISNFIDRYSDNTSPSRQLHRENNAEDNAQT